MKLVSLLKIHLSYKHKIQYLHIASLLGLIASGFESFGENVCRLIAKRLKRNEIVINFENENLSIRRRRAILG